MSPDQTAPLLTIVVAAYQMERYLAQCLSSLAQQTAPDFRAIIVDDASTDGTFAIASRYCAQSPELFHCEQVSHRGLGAVRNYGLSLVETPFVMFLDADDWLPAEFVACLRKRLDAHPQADIVFTLPRRYDQQTGTYEPWYDHDVIVSQLCALPQPFDAQSAPMIFGMEPSAASKVFRVSFLRDIGFAYPEGVLWEDVVPYFLAVTRAHTCAVMAESGFVNRCNREQQITRTRSRRVLEMMPQLLRAHAIITGGNWSDAHWACFLTRMLKLSMLMVTLCTPGAVCALSRQIHHLYRSIPQVQWQYFTESAPGRKQTLYAAMMRSRAWLAAGVAFYLFKQLYRTRG